MNRGAAIAAAGLFVAAVWLGWEVWTTALERTANQAEVSAKKRELAALRAKLESETTAPSAGHESESPQASTKRPAMEVGSAASTPVDPRIADRDKEMFRRNALHEYITGLDRLNLPPDTLGLVKDIILARVHEASAVAPEPSRSWTEKFDEMNRLEEATDDRLAALLGVEATAELKSASLEGAIDWTIGTDLWDAGVPLDSGQLRALARAEVQTGYHPNHWPLPEDGAQQPDPRTLLSRQDTALLAATAGFLSEGQQAALQRSLIEDHRYNAAMRTFVGRQTALPGP